MTGPFDLVILGGGPAGLAAYRTATECGLKVALIDEARDLGGRIYRGIARAQHDGVPLHPAYGAEGAWAAAEIGDADGAADVMTGHSVIDLTRDGDGLWQADVLGPSGLRRIGSRRILVATGAKERPFICPGWTLSGVMTAGGVQTLMKDSGCVPCGPVVLAGSGPLLLVLACQLAGHGVEIAALLDTTPAGNRIRAAPWLPAALLSGPTVWQGIALLRRVRRLGIPRYRQVTECEAHGPGQVTSVGFRAGGRAHRLPCALLITHLGIVPDTQLTRLAGCAHRWSPDLRGFVPDTGADGQTSLEGLSVAGDAQGGGGAIAARNAGHRAAFDAARRLGALSSPEHRTRMRPLEARHRRLGRERRFLDRLFAPGPPPWASVPDETLLCRCEEVSFGVLRDMIRAGVRDADRFKALTRCGMGPCQGRICGDLAASALADGAGLTPGEARQMKIRPPLRPVPLQALAGGADIGAPLPGETFVYSREDR